MVNEKQDPMLPAWKGLFEWSIKNQTAGDGTGPPRQVSKEDTEWLQQAMEANVQDVAKRMMEIKGRLDQAPGSAAAPTLQQREDLLDELLEIVEDIDFAKDLRGIGGLPTLLNLLADPEASIRSRAAGIVAASAQSNPPVQQWLLDGGTLPPLLAQTRDEDAAARTAAFTAISCLVRHCAPAMDAFLKADGLQRLADALRDPQGRVQRKGAQLAVYTIGDRPALAASAAVCDPGAGATAAIPALLGSGERPVREAALALAAALARHPASAAALHQEPGFKAALQRLTLALEDSPDTDAAADELHLVRALAAAPQDVRQTTSDGAAGSTQGTAGAAAMPLLLGPPAGRA